MTLTVHYPETHLYHRYPRQTGPQGTYLELDPEERTLHADWNGEIGNAVPADVWHGRIRRYYLPNPYLTADAIQTIMDEAAPLCETVCNGYDERWNGHNHVGALDEAARGAEEEIERLLEQYDGNTIQVMDAAEWFEALDCTIIQRMRAGEEPQAILDDLMEEYETPEELVLEHVDQYIEELQERAEETD